MLLAFQAMTDAGHQEWDHSAYISIRCWRDRLLRPLSRLLAAIGVSAPAVSLLGVLLAAITCWSIDHSARWALLAFLGALACDALDGALARHRGTDSVGGKVLDHACDTATFLLILLAVARCGLASTQQVAISALLAVPLLMVAIQARRRRRHVRQEPSGGFLAHVYKVPIYVAFLAYAAGGIEFLDASVRLANSIAALSLVLLIVTLFRPQRAQGRPHAATDSSN